MRTGCQQFLFSLKIEEVVAAATAEVNSTVREVLLRPLYRGEIVWIVDIESRQLLSGFARCGCVTAARLRIVARTAAGAYRNIRLLGFLEYPREPAD